MINMGNHGFCRQKFILSSHILAFCPSYFDIFKERSTFAPEFNIINEQEI